MDASQAERLGRSSLSIARSALSLARSAQAERDNESCFFDGKLKGLTCGTSMPFEWPPPFSVTRLIVVQRRGRGIREESVANCGWIGTTV
ncbi:hypothetical protein EVAR_43864_1 [Eumeta japonica]|uniref:Uncharacterized protein n=1 Tax=Eumeta variegata TaxID=151549 RepID=A0A4C1WZ32_EUMVA|nr:hypothetical protein EVAR_43864_1 [Eumeta japonica]